MFYFQILGELFWGGGQALDGFRWRGFVIRAVSKFHVSLKNYILEMEVILLVKVQL